MSIKDSIQQLAKTGIEHYAKICKVTAVDKTARTIDVEPIDGTAAILGVNLQAAQGRTLGVVQIPVVDSCVVVAFLSHSRAVVVCCEEVESVFVSIEEASIEITKDGMVVNGGSVGATKTDVLVEKINALEDNLNSILMALKGISITTIPTPKTPVVFAPFFATINSIIISKQSELEDTKLKH